MTRILSVDEDCCLGRWEVLRDTQVSLPLAGVSIVDFTWVGVGPFATKFLADFGADVIKIESSKRMDVVRLMHPAAEGKIGPNRSGYFTNRNSSKRSITLNLRMQAGQQLAKRLVSKADVVVNNFSPGVMHRLGMGWDAVHALNERIVYVDMPMQGMSGPHSKFRGYGAMIQALSGLHALTGCPGRVPTGTGTNYPDHVPNPLHTAIAIVNALLAVQSSGRGTYIEIAQLESSVNALGPWVMAAANGRADIGPIGNEHPDFFPQGVFMCSDDRWCALTVRSDRQWRDLCEIVSGDGILLPPKLTLAERRDQAKEILAAIAAWMKKRPSLEASRLLQRAAVPAGAVLHAGDVLEDENLKALGHWIFIDHPEMGQVVYDAPVARLSRTPAALRARAPLLGEHTAEVLKDRLSMSDAEISHLQDLGVLD